jgi:hypothetical protein
VDILKKGQKGQKWQKEKKTTLKIDAYGAEMWYNECYYGGKTKSRRS